MDKYLNKNKGYLHIKGYNVPIWNKISFYNDARTLSPLFYLNVRSDCPPCQFNIFNWLNGQNGANLKTGNGSGTSPDKKCPCCAASVYWFTLLFCFIMCTGHGGLPFNVITGWLQSTITVITLCNSNVLLEKAENPSCQSALQQKTTENICFFFTSTPCSLIAW